MEVNAATPDPFHHLFSAIVGSFQHIPLSAAMQHIFIHHLHSSDLLYKGPSNQTFTIFEFSIVLGQYSYFYRLGETGCYKRRSSECLGILPQFPISLGGKIVCVDVIVVQGPLDFNMLLGRDYVYAMNAVVSTLFWVMHFPHNGSIVTIDQLAADNHHPNSTLF
jgi:hypothetical protein